MRIRLALVLGMVVTLTTSCATQALWKATDPDSLVTYRKDGGTGQTASERFGDHAVRFFLTPVTVGLDVLSVVPLIAVLSVPSYLDEVAIKSGGHPRSSSTFPEVEGAQ